ncbi:type 2 isopentenyl-diphosphate Delta-isomerase [Paracoccus aerius]|uniref:Isopentenyl-diphosphate delta-isomerase n=1 Tax=Paracoccus aerius TaxID=1915382 RepID=A0ABS1S4S3_9RHOB|nr:type 2 isopentenyl-diphosphate Delta-isomerase [Paracoccus aerius]MBL3673722.1 type 2 isopentenyl-diphosphate Delta-isomerase [Paracoccus aerius]GHG22853.1 isopentenyl-diphosphate delta-isomerase [Paracoccus aerius]
MTHPDPSLWKDNDSGLTLTSRKEQHLDVVLAGKAGATVTTGLEAVLFEHVALPEVSWHEVDLSTRFLGCRIDAPVMIGSMTGGPRRAGAINRTLAQVCQQLRLPLAVGSQRVVIEGGEAAGLDGSLRRLAPDIPILANFGAAQLNRGFGRDEAMRAVEAIGASALILHLNPLQEAVQPEGDRDWRGLAAKIGALARDLPVPVVVKEVGAGLSGPVVARLAAEGVGVFDVAGSGGTDWAKVEAARAPDPAAARVAACFAGWGIPTAQAIRGARQAAPDATIIGSGGIVDGLDAARAIRLGADVVSLAGAVLASAIDGPEALLGQLDIVLRQLRTACFCTGSADLAALRQARLRQPA